MKHGIVPFILPGRSPPRIKDIKDERLRSTARKPAGLKARLRLSLWNLAPTRRARRAAPKTAPQAKCPAGPIIFRVFYPNLTS
eukprot:220270-Pyramimonas_sp.AAC.1